MPTGTERVTEIVATEIDARKPAFWVSWVWWRDCQWGMPSGVFCAWFRSRLAWPFPARRGEDGRRSMSCGCGAGAQRSEVQFDPAAVHGDDDAGGVGSGGGEVVVEGATCSS